MVAIAVDHLGPRRPRGREAQDRERHGGAPRDRRHAASLRPAGGRERARTGWGEKLGRAPAAAIAAGRPRTAAGQEPGDPADLGDDERRVPGGERDGGGDQVVGRRCGALSNWPLYAGSEVHFRSSLERTGLGM